jgi:predicted transcriptional regulator
MNSGEALPDVQSWQLEQINKSLEQADAGNLLARGKVLELVRAWRRRGRPESDGV